eukprot:5426276-Prymnesium_polylepis.1
MRTSLVGLDAFCAAMTLAIVAAPAILGVGALADSARGQRPQQKASRKPGGRGRAEAAGGRARSAECSRARFSGVGSSREQKAESSRRGLLLFDLGAA